MHPRELSASGAEDTKAAQHQAARFSLENQFQNFRFCTSDHRGRSTVALQNSVAELRRTEFLLMRASSYPKMASHCNFSFVTSGNSHRLHTSRQELKKAGFVPLVDMVGVPEARLANRTLIGLEPKPVR